MKLNSSTFTIKEDYKNIKLKTLKPLFMPNLRSQILFKRTIEMYNNKNIPKIFNPFEGSIIINNLKKPKFFNRSCILSKNINNKSNLLNYKRNITKYKIKRLKSENDINILYLNESNSKNISENKDRIPIKYFNLFSGNNGYNKQRSSVCMDFNIKSKNIFHLKKFKISNTKYWLNDSNINNYKDIINSREMKVLNKNDKKELKVKYYKWFI